MGRLMGIRLISPPLLRCWCRCISPAQQSGRFSCGVVRSGCGVVGSFRGVSPGPSLFEADWGSPGRGPNAGYRVARKFHKWRSRQQVFRTKRLVRGARWRIRRGWRAFAGPELFWGPSTSVASTEDSRVPVTTVCPKPILECRIWSFWAILLQAFGPRSTSAQKR